MADFNLPTTTSTYANFVTELDGRLDDMVRMLSSANTTPTNLPTNSVRWNDGSFKWERWSGTAWADLAATYGISVSGNAGTVTNGVYTTGSYANPAWITSLAGSKITGNITGNAGTATALATARTINGVSFDGTANISINANNAVTFNSGGAGDASGSTFNGSAARTISYNSIGAPSVTGANASGTWAISISGNAATATTAAACSGNSATATAATTATTVNSTGSNRVGDLAFGTGEATIYSYATNAIAMRLGAAGSYKQHNFAANGDISIAGGLAAVGNVTAYSDERIKTNWRPVRSDFVSTLAQVRSGIYDRTDIPATQAGVSAQSMWRLLPEVVSTDSNGTMSLAYGNAALVACVELAKEVVSLRGQIAELKGA